MRDTLLRTGITATIEDHSRMDINLKGPTDSIIPTTESKIGVRTVAMTEDHTATVIEVRTAAKREGTATRTGGDPTAIRTGAPTATRIEVPVVVARAAQENVGQE